MLDIEIKKFYDKIKDPAWPEIRNYLEFCKLSENIKNECVNIHGFNERKLQIIDNNYWSNEITDICVFENLAYVPIPKCAYMYHTTLFTNLGWKKVLLKDVDVSSTKFFGLMMHPLTRWLKGITQWVTDCYKIGSVPKKSNQWAVDPCAVNWNQLNSDFQTEPFKKLISTVNVGDRHSMPYSGMFGDFLNTVNWIPMDSMSDNEVKISMMKFFNLSGHNITLPLNDQRIHESSANQLELFNNIKTEYFNNQNQIYFFYQLYNNDLKFYYNLLDTFDQDWSHI